MWEELLGMYLVPGSKRAVLAIAAIGLSTSLVAGTAAPMVQAKPVADTLFLNGQGSTFIQPLMAKWAFVYSGTVDKSTRINYVGTGSGAGVSAFTSGLVDFAGTDAFLKDAQVTAAKGDVLHIPMTIGPVAVIYNLPGLSKPIQLDGVTLGQIFLGKITSWNDKAIASQNPGVTLPNTPVQVVHRADGSGTTNIFTNYLQAASSDWKAQGVGASTIVNWPTGQGAKGTPGVAAAVKRTLGGIGYAELSFAVSNNLPVASIKNKNGEFVAPSPAGSAADAAGAPALPADLRAFIVDEPGKGAYPITGFSWVVIHQKAENAPSASKYPALLKFLWWGIHQGQAYSSSGVLRYAALPANVVALDEAKIKSVTLGGKPAFTGK